MENHVSKWFPREVKSAKTKVFVWEIVYVADLAATWLSRQELDFQDAARAFDLNKRKPEDGHLDRLAQYVLCKVYQGAALVGTLYYQTIGANGKFKGWGNFSLQNAPPLPIEVSGRDRGKGEVQMYFQQAAIPLLEIAPGLKGTIPAFNYNINFVGEGPSLEGDLIHPHYPAPNPLRVGTTRLEAIE